jgi:hypothetical protein
MLVIDDDGAGNPSAAATVICPAATKPYIVQNICGQTVTVKTSAGTGVAIPNNQSALVFCNGTNVVTGAFNGDVVGPASATDNAVARYDGTTGKIIQNSAVTIADDGATVIDVNSTSAGLRITQTGTGNALLIEDEANPDASPFVVDATGKVVLGGQTTQTIITDNNYLQVQQTAAGYALTAIRYTNDTNSSVLLLAKSRGTVAGNNTIVNSDDNVGTFLFAAADGTAFKSLASIAAFVDGTPGTDDMPGRLILATTADGASTPTERIRISNAGVTTITGTGIINANSTSDALRITQTGTGNALVVEDATNPDVTPFVIDANGDIFVASPTSVLIADQTVVKTQIHTSAAAATNTGIYSWSASGAAAPRMAFARSVSGTVGTQSSVSNGNSLMDIRAYGSDGASFVEAARIRAEVDGTPGTNDMPGRLMFSTTADGASSPTERMRITSSGKVGIGATPTSISFALQLPISGGSTAYGVRSLNNVTSGVTSSARVFTTETTVDNEVFTLASLEHFAARQGTFGASATVTNQYGFRAESSLTGATNNYGFFSNIASGTGRWNFYANGTAANYFAGDMQLDKTVTAGGTTGAQTINKNAGTVNFAAAATSLVVTDSRVTTSSIIICTVGTNDTTLKSVAAVAGTGSFTLHASAAATAETRVNFLIIN